MTHDRTEIGAATENTLHFEALKEASEDISRQQEERKRVILAPGRARLSRKPLFIGECVARIADNLHRWFNPESDEYNLLYWADSFSGDDRITNPKNGDFFRFYLHAGEVKFETNMRVSAAARTFVRIVNTAFAEK